MTIEEIKNLVYPKENVNWIEILKELTTQKFGENKLVTIQDTYLCGTEYPNYAWAVAVINDKLFILTNDGEGYNCRFGNVIEGNDFNIFKGIGLTDTAAITICKNIFEEKHYEGYDVIAFDFEKMKGYDWFNDFFKKEIEKNKEKYNSLITGETTGCIKIT